MRFKLPKRSSQPTPPNWGAVQAYYNRCADTISHPAKAMGWSSSFTQSLRFDVMTLMVDFHGASVLDVGCGDAAFFHYCLDHRIDCDYHGIDVSDSMVRRAHERYPGVSVRQGNLMDTQCEADIVICSGALSMVPGGDPMKWLTDAIDRMCQLARHHVVFNVLTAVRSSRFQWYDPMAVLAHCFSVTPYVSLNHAYLEHDMTVYMAVS